jgi:hypothetical protein
MKRCLLWFDVRYLTWLVEVKHKDSQQQHAWKKSLDKVLDHLHRVDSVLFGDVPFVKFRTEQNGRKKGGVKPT